MFIVCEPIAWGMEHVPFNAAFLKTIRLAYQHEDIYFYAEQSHAEHVKKQIGSYANSISWSTLVLPPRHSGFYSRFISDFKTIKFLLDRLNDNHSKAVLVITFGNASILWALKYFIGAVNKNKQIQVVLHGDFSQLRYRDSLKDIPNPFYHMGTFKTALRFSCDQRIRYIVLEEAIHNAIMEKMPFLHNCFHVLDHPVPGDKKPVEVCDFKAPIQFGFLGCASERKGFSKYLNVASDIKMRLPNMANFHFIGYIVEHQKKYNFSGLCDKPTTQRLERDEYIRLLNKLHFVCLFYDRHYELTASGVLLDCVEYGKPIIASKLPIFENLERRIGDIGYLCDADEFIDIILNILRNIDPDRYSRQVRNMLRIKMSRSPEIIANKYYELVESYYES